jgi:hypothetical protein
VLWIFGYLTKLCQFQGLKGPGTESRWRRDSPYSSRLAMGPTRLLIKWVPDFFPGVKRPWRGVNHTPPSSVEVNEIVELYLYSPFVHLWLVLGRTLPFYISSTKQCVSSKETKWSHVIFLQISARKGQRWQRDTTQGAWDTACCMTLTSPREMQPTMCEIQPTVCEI